MLMGSSGSAVGDSMGTVIWEVELIWSFSQAPPPLMKLGGQVLFGGGHQVAGAFLGAVQ